MKSKIYTGKLLFRLPGRHSVLGVAGCLPTGGSSPLSGPEIPQNADSSSNSKHLGSSLSLAISLFILPLGKMDTRSYSPTSSWAICERYLLRRDGKSSLRPKISYRHLALKATSPPSLQSPGHAYGYQQMGTDTACDGTVQEPDTAYDGTTRSHSALLGV